MSPTGRPKCSCACNDHVLSRLVKHLNREQTYRLRYFENQSRYLQQTSQNMDQNMTTCRVQEPRILHSYVWVIYLGISTITDLAYYVT